MRVLVLAPHPDDEVLGCGGTLAKHVDAGAEVHVAYLTSGEAGLPEMSPEEACRLREQEAADASAVLGITRTTFLHQRDWALEDDADEAAERISDLLAVAPPDTVYLPHPADGHPDHGVCSQILAHAVRASGVVAPTVLSYEIWTPLPYYDVVEDITVTMDRKVRAMRAYATQLRRHSYTRAAIGLGAYRGALAAGSRYAEVFKYEIMGSSPG